MQSEVLLGIFWLIIIMVFIGICVRFISYLKKIGTESRTRLQHRSPRQFRKEKKRIRRSQGRAQFVPIQLAMCSNCEATILADAKVCPHCGNPRPFCIVCSAPVIEIDSILVCPNCKGRAHRIHFLEYLKIKGVCPNCHVDLDSHDLIDESRGEPSVRPQVSPRHLCTVCHGAIGVSDLVLLCPYCQGTAHRSHILEYVKVKGQCPYCFHDLDEHNLRSP